MSGKKDTHGTKHLLNTKSLQKAQLFQLISGEIKEKEKIDPILNWSILKSVPANSIITKRCPLCLQENLAIISYEKPEELLNKRSELISKCRHQNKFLISQC